MHRTREFPPRFSAVNGSAARDESSAANDHVVTVKSLTLKELAQLPRRELQAQAECQINACLLRPP